MRDRFWTSFWGQKFYLVQKTLAQEKLENSIGDFMAMPVGVGNSLRPAGGGSMGGGPRPNPSGGFGGGGFRPEPVRGFGGASPATAIPAFKKGGTVKKTGLAKVHKGEKIIPASKVKKVEKAVKSASKKK